MGTSFLKTNVWRQLLHYFSILLFFVIRIALLHSQNLKHSYILYLRVKLSLDLTSTTFVGFEITNDTFQYHDLIGHLSGRVQRKGNFCDPPSILYHGSNLDFLYLIACGDDESSCCLLIVATVAAWLHGGEA